MELLIIKTQNGYIRFKDDGYHLCALDKASVFPMNKLDQVKSHLSDLQVGSYPDAVINKLILTEEPFTETE